MTRGAQAGGEDLRRHNEGGAIGSEVGEEESQPVHDHEPGVVARGPVVIRHGETQHENRHKEEAHQLDGEPSNFVDQRDSEPIPGHGTAHGDDGLSPGNPVHFLDGVHGAGLGDPPDGTKDILLEEVLTVESDIEEEPRGCGPQ